MATSPEAHRQKYLAAIRQARRGGDAAFQAWFNRQAAQTLEQCITRGYWDFALHILTPAVCAHLNEPEKLVVLEIGYGGGRLINAACSYFGDVIGIDVHAEQKAVAAFLHTQQKHNFRLLQTSGETIDVVSESIDFIYSFIVLQHLPAFATFVRYLSETYRCLKPGGVAQLYFGRFARLHPIYQLRYFFQGYKETHGAPANHISLVVRMARARWLCKHIGFQVIDSGTSYFRVPDGYANTRGGQSYVTLLKRET
jgi:SAM-dependent methyltransferase